MVLENEIANLVQATNNLTGVVDGKIKEIDNKGNEVVNRVNAAIPNALHDEQYKHVYLDTVGGDDVSATGLLSAPFKTLSALINAMPSGSVAVVRGNDGLVVDIDTDITLVNKHVILFVRDMVVNINALIHLWRSSMQFSYPITLNQTVVRAFAPASATLSFNGGVLTPSSDAKALVQPSFPGASVTYPGGLVNDIVLSRMTVADSPSNYELIAPTHYKSIMSVIAFQMTLGANVALFSPLYEVTQFGAKGAYLIGA